LGQGKKNKEIKNFLEFKEYKCTTHTNLWDTMKVVQKDFIVLRAFIKKLVRSLTINLTAQLKSLKQKKQTHLKRSRWEEIIKIRAEINKRG
jgi:type IV secretory pathway VirB4 component